MIEDTFLSRLTTRISARMDEWHRTSNPRRKQILKHELWTLHSVLRDYKAQSTNIFASQKQTRVAVERAVH
ncbi:MAG: hypothetical protein DHS20C11_09200 [Lysobacteraceae bacterium]|nr:MAG: hypothetical protein DHS20C11_09200 [Xanthomonadaceae bacterium]